ncbi:bifunctional serine/threonine-protein kinase/formylglycine-generating enzyme family protein [Candidatus Uabimicrobium sp. HlEnr_7]|uniref:bifunctional serine/threonine-protein kinase/formylglycine-generating enzyme family protein n=1 Tax=Candidatus Uabimicrobium helgolandensis TaxID=3095367 RepID=UPI00355707B6
MGINFNIGDDSTQRILLGRYRVIEELGRGGMGAVYKAHDAKLDRIVAVKFIYGGKDKEMVDRFRREASTLAQLQHPNIVSSYDIVEEGEHLFLVMEYVDGKTLKQMLQDKTLTLKNVLKIMTKVTKAVHFIHKHKIIHRDLKPCNIMINKKLEPKIMDFGLAKTKGNSDLSHTGQVLGTLRFMSPEQAEGEKDVDHLTDVYAIGCILYQITTGQPFITGKNLTAIMSQILFEKPVPPKSMGANIPESLQKICLKSLHKKKEQRPQKARFIAEYLVESMQQATPEMLKQIVPLNTTSVEREATSIKKATMQLEGKKRSAMGKTQMRSRNFNTRATIMRARSRKKSKTPILIFSGCLIALIVVVFSVKSRSYDFSPDYQQIKNNRQLSPLEIWGQLDNLCKKVNNEELYSKIVRDLESLENTLREHFSENITAGLQNPKNIPHSYLVVPQQDIFERLVKNDPVFRPLLLKYNALLNKNIQKQPQNTKNTQEQKVENAANETLKKIRAQLRRKKPWERWNILQNSLSIHIENEGITQFIIREQRTILNNYKRKLKNLQVTLQREYNGNADLSLLEELRDNKTLTRELQKEIDQVIAAQKSHQQKREKKQQQQEFQQKWLEFITNIEQQLEMSGYRQVLKSLQELQAKNINTLQPKNGLHIVEELVYINKFYQLAKKSMSSNKNQTYSLKKKAIGVRITQVYKDYILVGKKRRYTIENFTTFSLYRNIPEKYLDGEVLYACAILFSREKRYKWADIAFKRAKKNGISRKSLLAKQPNKVVKAKKEPKIEFPRRWKQKIWKICWNNKEKYLDFTNQVWRKLPVKTRIEYTRSYQEWYAKTFKIKLKTQIDYNGSTIHLVLIPTGKFTMGRGQKRIVHISKPFFISQHEITVKQWTALDDSLQNSDYPAVSRTWEDMQRFCTTLNVDLPTEAQWEYVCRSGMHERFHWGEELRIDVSNSLDYWYKQPVQGFEEWKAVHKKINSERLPVGKFPANNFGVYDMIGNVWEIVRDYSKNEAGEFKDPIGKNPQLNKYTMRGGSSIHANIVNCNTTSREYVDNVNGGDFGWRVIKEIK